MTGENESNKTMKVTLLSGFLGAGKTTLLKRILRLNNDRPDDEKLKMAVIVNDMGEINLDAEEIKNSKVIQEDAEMVEMQNGCICCTLRGDLLKTVKALSEDERAYDYLVIESTGIGEPLPVAQTFAMDVDQMTPKGKGHHHHHHDGEEHNHNHGEEEGGEVKSDKTTKLSLATEEKNSLFHYAKLDTLVTVVDALNIYDVLSSLQTLADKDNISGMLGNTGSKGEDEIETTFPGGEEALRKQMATIMESSMKMPIELLQRTLEGRGMDPSGTKDELVERITVSFANQFLPQKDERSIAKLWLDQIEFCNVIVVSKAQQFLAKHNGDEIKLKQVEDMLQKLSPEAKIIVPTQDMYGDLDVSTELINTGMFDMEEASNARSWAQELESDHTPETEEYGIGSTTFVSSDKPFHPERLRDTLGGFGDWLIALKSSTGSGDDTKEAKDEEETFRGIVRTKGQIWLANSPAFPLYFQTAGHQVELQPGQRPFLCEIPGFSTEHKEDYDALVENGFWTEKYGDRRSQLVFIGVGLDAGAIHKRLQAALLTEEETAELMDGKEKWRDFKDPFFGGKLAKANDDHYDRVALVEKMDAEKGG